jgi:N-acyl-D-amino-acid deacylase
MKRMVFDLLILNGRVFDGTGNNPDHCDIGVKGGRIAATGTLSDAAAGKVIDAAGLSVCPGFIDAHSHSDVYLLIEPSAASKVYQGITTEICGNCGASAAPLNGGYRLPADWEGQLEALGHGVWGVAHGAERTGHYDRSTGSVPVPWRTVGEYRQLYDKITPAINAALLIGHNTLHAGICGYEPRAGTPEEMARMQGALERALDEGAIGLSSGLAYPPGSAVPREELVELSRTAARHGGIYTTHMRSESDRLLEAIDEAIHIAESSGARLQISHLKASGRDNWDRLDSAFEKIRAAAGRIPLGSDRYPYTAGCTDLDIVLPDWASHGGRDAILTRLREPSARNRIRDELMESPVDRWTHVMIGSTQFQDLKGQYLPEAAGKLGMNEVDTLLHLIDRDELKTGGIFFGMSEENMWRVLAEPYVSIGSDGSMRAPWGPLHEDHPHPRAYGSHTRFLRAALDGQTVALPEAIRKMTSLPAEQFGLTGRGRIREGYAADIAVFNPEAIREHTSYADPHRLSGGMQHVIVNGCHTLENGRLAASRGGKFLPGQ